MRRSRNGVIAAIIVMAVWSVIVPSALAAPANNPVLPASTWRGYGVDWMYRSLRVGTSHADSLLEDGWIFCDSLYTAYISIGTSATDSVAVDHILLGVNLLGAGAYADLDSIEVDHITGTNLVLSGPASADSIEADHHVGVNAVFSGPLGADSIDADHFTGSDMVLSGALSVDSVEADHHVGVDAAFSGPASADSVAAVHMAVTSSFNVPHVTDAGMAATAGSAGDIVFNTADSRLYGCRVTGDPATWAALH